MSAVGAEFRSFRRGRIGTVALENVESFVGEGNAAKANEYKLW